MDFNAGQLFVYGNVFWQVIMPKLKTYINSGKSFQYWLGFTLSYDGFGY